MASPDNAPDYRHNVVPITHRINNVPVKLGTLSLDEMIILEGHCIERADNANAELRLVQFYREQLQEDLQLF